MVVFIPKSNLSLNHTTYSSTRFKRQQKQHVSTSQSNIQYVCTAYTVGIRSTIALLLFDVMMWFPHSPPLETAAH